MKINRFLSAAIFGFAITFTFSCSSGDDGGDDPNGGSPSSSGGGKNKCTDIANCKRKPIGNQVWLAENLNIDVGEGSTCYEGKSAYCDKYGRLYTWATAMALPSKCNSTFSTSDADCAINTPHRGICPSGWHIPSNDDWNVLMKTVNPSCSDNSHCEGAGTKLKAKGEWNSYSGVPSGTDEFGFSALPGGLGIPGGVLVFDDVGNYGGWWSASEDDSSGADVRSMFRSLEVVRYSIYDKDFLLSVRCVKD